MKVNFVLQRRWIMVLILIIGLILFNSCARKIYEVTYPTLLDGKYDSEFPYRSSSKQLEEIGASVKMLSVIAFYKNNIIVEHAILTEVGLSDAIIDANTIEITRSNTSASGTATIINYNERRIALLTCAHIIDFPDTVITFHKSDNSNNSFIKSIAVKVRQINYISDLPEGGDIDIIFMDSELDIAIVGKQLKHEPDFPIKVLEYPFGKARELEWGSFVYLMGFPVGHKMITKGIVSSPRMDRNTAFMIDAPFNRGSSGGIVLAIRDGIPNFELVGIANSVAAKTNYMLAPEEDIDYAEWDKDMPYKGQMYLRQQENIRYGVTHIITIEAIVKALKKNQKEFLKQGYDFRKLYD